MEGKGGGERGGGSEPLDLVGFIPTIAGLRLQTSSI